MGIVVVWTLISRSVSREYERAFVWSMPNENLVVVLSAAVVNDLTAVMSGAKGENLLYFGCRHKEKDFLYREELRKSIFLQFK